MKTTASIIVSLCLCCLMGMTGCSDKDEPQSLEISGNEFTVKQEGGSFEVKIMANCPWTTACASRLTTVSPTQGDGNGVITVTVSENNLYENATFPVFVSTEDGTITREIFITQNMKKNIEITGSKEIEVPALGGSFEIRLKSNVKDLVCDIPDYVSILHESVSSVYNYYYFMSIGTNTEMQERTSVIRFSGEGIEATVIVKQASVAPSEVIVEGWKPNVYDAKDISFNINVRPAYSDISKLSVESSNPDVCTASIVGGKLHLNFSGTGSSVITIREGENELFSQSINNSMADAHFMKLYAGEYYVGQERRLEVSLPTGAYEIISSNPSVAIIEDDNNMIIKGEGTAVLTLRSLIDGSEDKCTVEGRKALLFSRLGHIKHLIGDRVDFSVRTTIQSSLPIRVESYVVKDANGSVLSNTGSLSIDSATSITISTESIIRSYWGDMWTAVRGLKFYVKGTLGGEPFEYEVDIDTSHVG